MPGRIPTQGHRPKYLTPLVQPSGDAEGSPKHPSGGFRDEVEHLAILPKKRVHSRAPSHRVDIEVHVAGAGDLSVLVHEEGGAVRAAQGPQVSHGSATPQNCV